MHCAKALRSPVVNQPKRILRVHESESTSAKRTPTMATEIEKEGIALSTSLRSEDLEISTADEATPSMSAMSSTLHPEESPRNEDGTVEVNYRNDFTGTCKSPGQEAMFGFFRSESLTSFSRGTLLARFPTPTRSHLLSRPADSPYFSAFCEAEMGTLDVLGDTLYDISDRVKTFVRTGERMSEATRRLSTSCMLRREVGNPDSEDFAKRQQEENEAVHIRKAAIGEEMSNVLGLLGGVRRSRFAVCRTPSIPGPTTTTALTCFVLPIVALSH